MDHIPEAQNIKRAILVGVSQPGISMQDARESLEELANLAETAGFEEVERVIQNRSRLDPAYYIGSGKAEELKATVADNDVDAIVFDNDLSPTQMRNLELLTDARILDRSLLILDIFALHAQTRTAQLQVQMAHIRYIRPRLHTFNPHKARQAGGRAGETWVETSRRNIDYREQTVYAGLKRVQRQMAISRKHRKANAFQVTLVGYTNAGKSTLMRALSGEEVLIQDQLFATLTPTSRAVYLDRQKRRIVLTDSVGFIKRLPHHLFESFRATLAEAVNADLLLHVVDASHPTFLSQIDAVHEVLGKLEIRDKPILLVYNKMDRVDPKRTQEIQKTCEN
ncbi:MAG: GTPase HflX, partial [bacterium]|nr:GTPase HflX [bacterium]